MDVICLHDLEQLGPWAEALEQVSLASRKKDPFSTVGFIRNLAAHSAWYPGDQGVEPWFLIALEAGRPVGYLALRRVVSRVLGCETAKLEFFVTHDNDCPQLVARVDREAEVSAAFYRYLLGRGDEWSFLEFHQQDPASALATLPPEPGFRGYFVREFPTRENNTIPLRWPTLDAYVAALSTKWRGEVKRKARRLLAAGKLTWLSSDDPNATPSLLRLVQMIEARSWKSHHVIALGSHPDRLAFFEGLLSPEQPSRMRISVLLLDGLPIAGSICAGYAGTYYGLVVVFDDRAEHLSPGVFTQLLMVRTAIEGNYRALDLLASYAYYKAKWLAQQTPTRSIQVFHRGKPWFWKAILGDLKRKVMVPVHAGAAETPAFNPERREAVEGQEAELRAPLTASDDERRQISALLARLDGLPIERLGNTELAQVLTLGDKAKPAPKPEAPRAPSAAHP